MVDSSQIPYAIAIDFDGILCQNAYPDIGDPNWDTIHQALKEQSNGAKLILWTCREDGECPSGGEILRYTISR